MKRDPNEPRKPMSMIRYRTAMASCKNVIIPPPSKFQRPMRTIGKTHRGSQNKCLVLLKKVILQEYREAGFTFEKPYPDLDHIHGRSALGFKLGAMLDPRNLQLLDRKTHNQKTDGLISGDRRDTKITERLVDLSDRLWAKLGPLKFTDREYRKALRGELYGK